MMRPIPGPLQLTRRAVFVALLLGGSPAAAPALGVDSIQPGYWHRDQVAELLDHTLEVTLEADLSGLSDAERTALGELLAAGEIFHRLYELQRHPQSESSLRALRGLATQGADDARVRALEELFWIFKGPIATTLDNERQAFVPVDSERPGKNVYPWDVARTELETLFTTQPERRGSLLHLRRVVRRSTEANRSRDRSTLEAHPALAVLHPEFSASLDGPDPSGFYATPYAVAYADELAAIYRHLRAAARALDSEDTEFAGYLRHRARDLLAGDYEAGDAAWVTGRFGNLNAQLGSYETYDDALFGVKAFYGASLLVRDATRTSELSGALTGIQAIEDSLPYERPKQVRGDIPVAVYNVVADFGQARGTNTATILPNEAEHARKYGRTILLRYNVLTHPDLFSLAQARFRAALSPEFHDDLTLEAGFQRTLWHEIGHYLGVDRTADGRDLGDALQESSDLFEEMKSDLVALYAGRALQASGYYDAADLRGIYASGVLRVLQAVKPRRAQPYQTMQLMQWNYFLEHGLLSFDPATESLGVDYARYHAVVASLLREILAIQDAGDPRRARAFVDRYFVWRETLHEPIARRIREASRYRFRRVRYPVLED